VLGSFIAVGIVFISIEAVKELQQMGDIALSVSGCAALVLVIGNAEFSIFCSF
jgi:hypothetical protein